MGQVAWRFKRRGEGIKRLQELDRGEIRLRKNISIPIYIETTRPAIHALHPVQFTNCA